MSTPKTAVRIAVEPLLAEAVDRAEREARAVVVKVMADIESHGWNITKAAPWPSSIGLRVGQPEYAQGKSKYTLYHSLVQTISTNYRPNEPEIVKPDLDRQQRFIAESREAAALQYESYICKLEDKVGDHSEATLAGSHVWGHSVLTVTTPEGIERWQTQMIVNVSKLGKLFNQFPTRKVR